MAARTVSLPKHWLLPDHVDTSWQERAMCRGVVTDGTVKDDRVIFPFDKDEPDPTVEFRKTMCGRCPVRQACLRFALTMGYTGVWGGYNLREADLRKFRQELAKLQNVDLLQATA